MTLLYVEMFVRLSTKKQQQQKYVIALDSDQRRGAHSQPEEDGKASLSQTLLILTPAISAKLPSGSQWL